jgi:hypothetical protein
MKEISLERIRSLLSYNPETGSLTWLARPRSDFADTRSFTRWATTYEGTIASHIGGRGYVVVHIAGQNYLGHRLAWALHFGTWPDSQIDHINHIRADNRIVNLREVDHAGNARNASIAVNNTSGVTGVSWSPVLGVWVAGIGHENKWVNLGKFDSRELATAARKDAERRFGYHPNHGRAA